MRGILAACVVLLAAPALSGCIAAAIGGGATAAGVAADRRTVGTVTDDFAIRSRINGLWFAQNEEILSKVSLQVNEGRVLLTGRVPDQQLRIDAVRLAWQADGVKEVINEITVAGETTLKSYVQDRWIGTQLRTRLLVEEGVETISYSIEVLDGTIYLMGIAEDKAELDRVTNIARNIRYVRRVVSYVRLPSEAEQGRT